MSNSENPFDSFVNIIKKSAIDVLENSEIIKQIKNENEFLKSRLNKLEEKFNRLILTSQNKPNVDPTKFKVLTIEEYEKLQKSLSEAYNAGKNEEHKRHLEEQDKAFLRGVNYAKNQETLQKEKTSMKKEDQKINEKENSPKVTYKEINNVHDLGELINLLEKLIQK